MLLFYIKIETIISHLKDLFMISIQFYATYIVRELVDRR